MRLNSEEKLYIWLDSFALEEGEKRRLLKELSLPALPKQLPLFKERVIKAASESVYNTMLASLFDGGKYFEALLGFFEEKGITPIAMCSKDYPECFLHKADEDSSASEFPAPIVLYAKGNISLLTERKFTVVGSRRTPAPFLCVGATIAKELSGYFTIVTGVADGGDSAAIEGALKGSGKVICVAAGGFSALPQGNTELLKRVEKTGLILSAHFYSSPVRKYSYAERNCLLAALGEGTLILSAGEKSGALITAEYTKKFGKPLFALPYSVGTAAGAGCNALIKKGAFLTENSVDIFSRLGIILKGEAPKENNLPSLTAEEQTVLGILKENGEAHISLISEKSGLPPYKLSVILSSLEVKGLVMKMGGNRYASF